MPTIHDSELGDIIVQKHAWSKSFRASLKPNGKLHVTAPPFMPLFMIKRQITASRRHLKQLINNSARIQYQNGSPIGKTHRVNIQQGETFAIRTHGTQMIVTLDKRELTSNVIQNAIRTQAIKLLRKEAKAYLPARLKQLASEQQLSYAAVRLSHAGTRWGSCSSTGTISLNIGLMNLPYELIDYVLLHELAHTQHMNHSEAFWTLLAQMDGSFKQHRKLLKTFSPHV